MPDSDNVDRDLKVGDRVEAASTTYSDHNFTGTVVAAQSDPGHFVDVKRDDGVTGGGVNYSWTIRTSYLHNYDSIRRIGAVSQGSVWDLI